MRGFERTSVWPWAFGAAIAVLLGVVLFAGCTRTRAVVDEYEQQLQALEQTWVQGTRAREFLASKALRNDRPRCSRMYRATVASKYRWDDKDLVAVGEEIFDQGCLGDGKPASAELLAKLRSGQ